MRQALFVTAIIAIFVILAASSLYGIFLTFLGRPGALAFVLVPALVYVPLGIVGWKIKKKASPILGKYVHEKTGTHYIELKANGECFVHEDPPGVTGRYEINGAEIAIFGLGSTSRGRIQNNEIIDSEGERWVRTG